MICGMNRHLDKILLTHMVLLFPYSLLGSPMGERLFAGLAETTKNRPR